MTISLNHIDVLVAHDRIAPHVRRTPVIEAHLPGLERGVWLKCEFMQHTGSFKARGAFNRVIGALEEAGVGPRSVGPQIVAASGGNAGLAVAHAASSLGQRAVVFVPETAPAVKVAWLRELGADVRLAGTEYAHAYDAAQAHIGATPDAIFVHAYDQPEIVAGQGTVALELLEQVSGDLDTLLVVVGGGGLMAGCATALRGEVQVVAVEPEAAPTLHDALEAGHPVDVAVGGVAADSLGARRVGDIAWDVARSQAVRSLLVPDEALVAARRDLWDRLRVVVEHGTAAAWAALLTGAYRPAAGERVGLLLCGANTDPATL